MPYRNDFGTVFRVTIVDNGVPISIPADAVKRIRFQKPSGHVITKTAAFETDGSDGIIKYVTVAGDVDVAGVWKIQGYVEFGGGGWSSVPEEFEVEDILHTQRC